MEPQHRGSPRQQILYYLRIHGPNTAKTLAEGLGVTISAIRQQVALLEEEGMVFSQRHIFGPGRPTHAYHLSEKAESAFEKRYEGVALDVLEMVLDEFGKKALSSLLKKRRERTVGEYRAQIEGLSQKEKMHRIAELQDSRGYMATMEVQGAKGILREFNCPFIEVAKKYPAFCETERKVYEDLLGEEVHLDHCRALGASSCCFTFAPKD